MKFPSGFDPNQIETIESVLPGTCRENRENSLRCGVEQRTHYTSDSHRKSPHITTRAAARKAEAPPTYAANEPSAERKMSEMPATRGIIIVRGDKKAARRGPNPPSTKLTEDVTAAWIGLAISAGKSSLNWLAPSLFPQFNALFSIVLRCSEGRAAGL